MSSAPKGHHVVAQMLLRRFSENGQVKLVSRDDFARTHTCNIANALKINNFYTIERIDGSTSTEVENPGFSSLEFAAADAIRQVVDAGRFPPTPRVREVMSLFLAYQLMRGEGARAAIGSPYGWPYQTLKSRAEAILGAHRETLADRNRPSIGTDPNASIRSPRASTSPREVSWKR